MFIASFTAPERAPEAWIYSDGASGRAAFIRDTWNPETIINFVLPLAISGRTYRERQNSARETAIEWQTGPASEIEWSYGELATVAEWFENAGRKYGLLREFRENGIC